MKSYWFCKDKPKYDTAYPNKNLGENLEELKKKIERLEERIGRPKKEAGSVQELEKEKQLVADYKAEIAGWHQRKRFKDDTEDTRKLHAYFEYCKAEIAEKGNAKQKPPGSDSPEAALKNYNNNSGFWAGLLLQELPKAYLCEIAKKPLYEEEGLMEVTDLSKKLTGEIFCTVQMGEEESEVIIGNIESAR